MEMVICANSKGKQLCQTCERFNENSDAKVWCSDCNEAMCGKCVEMHNRMKLLMKHQVVGMENLERLLFTLCQVNLDSVAAIIKVRIKSNFSVMFTTRCFAVFA